MRRRNSLQRRAGPFADRAPALDADEPRDLRLLRQGVELVERPGLLVLDQAVDDELVAVLVDIGRLLLGVVAVERERARDRRSRDRSGASRLGLNRRACTQSLNSRHHAQRLLRRTPVDDVAAGEQGERAEARGVAQEQPPRGIGQQLRRVLDEEAGIDARRRACGSAHRSSFSGRGSWRAGSWAPAAPSTTWTTRNSDDRRHGEEMHQPRALVAAEQGRQLLQLHRLPDGEAGGDDDDAGQQHAGIEQPSARRCSGEIVVAEPAGERGARDRARPRRPDRQQLAPEAAGREAPAPRRRARWRSAATWRRNARAGRRPASRPA